MKKQMRKLLCLVLVLMMAIPTIVLPASADAPTYDDFEEGELMYKVNFNGNDGVFEPPVKDASGSGWGTWAQRTVPDNGRSLTLKPTSSATTGSIWGNCLKYPNYRMVGSSYTTIFTLTASDENQEIGFYLDWNSGFIIKPGSNSFRYGVGKTGTTISGATGTYTRTDGEKPLAQTYAIEIKDEGSDNGAASTDYSAFTYNITEYNLYVLDGDQWKLLFQMSASKNAAAATEIKNNLNWISHKEENYEFVLRFYRNAKDANQADGTVKVSDMNIYKGIAVTDGYLETVYDIALDGSLLYDVAFDGSDMWEQTYGKPTSAWAGMANAEKDALLSNGKKTAELKPVKKGGEAAVYGGCLDPKKYPAKGNSYTITYTVAASDANQEVSFYADWSTGFSVIPGQNKFGYKSTTADSNKKRTVDELVVPYDEYDGTGSLTQTYAVEYKLDDSFNATEYNLYVANDGEWVLLCSLNENERSKTKWTSSDCEVVIRFCRDGENEYQTDGTITISNVKVYKGFAAKNDQADVPTDYVHKNYDETPYGEVVYKVNFKGDATYKPGTSWGGMTVPSSKLTNNSVTLQAKSEADNNADYTYEEKGSIWGEKIDDKAYPMLGHSYTAVFTVTASDADEAVGLYLDWQTGFIVAPGKNAYGYRVSDNSKDKDGNSNNGVNYEDEIALYNTNDSGKIVYNTYDGTGSLTQTYAIEVKDNGADGVYNCVAYNLYVVKNGEWMLIESLSGDELDWCKWSTVDYEYVLRFYRDSRIEGNAGTITISDMSIYKGLAATTGLLDAKEPETLTYKEATDGTLLYDVNFNGTSGVFNGKSNYDGMKYETSSDGSSITLSLDKEILPSVSGSFWGGNVGPAGGNDQENLNVDYPARGTAYTVVFTISAEDANQTVGVLLKWKDGIFLTPGQNKYSIGRIWKNKDDDGNPTSVQKEIGEDVYEMHDTYGGAKALTQTYAIEFANGTEKTGNKGYAGYDQYDLQKYKLWVLQDGIWVLVHEFTETERQKLAWDTNDYEFVLHFARISKDDTAEPNDGDEDRGKVTISDTKIYKGNGILPTLEDGLIDGAAVRLKDKDTSGIRFSAIVSENKLAELNAKYDCEVTLGILIAPTDYLYEVDFEFTKEALGAWGGEEKIAYLEIDGTFRDYIDGYKRINCAMVNMKGHNLTREFSARLYVKNAEGEIVEYFDYNYADNSRSVATVAERAYNDIQYVKDDIYKNETKMVGGVTVYSPYENRENLTSFFAEANKPKSSITVMTYNIKGKGDNNYGGRDVSKAIQTIIDASPDVVGIQEDDRDLDSYTNKLKENGYASVDGGGYPDAVGSYISGNRHSNDSEYNAIWYKTSKFTVKDFGCEYYKALKDKAPYSNNETVKAAASYWKNDEQDRFFRWAILEDTAGVQYLIVNTHWHHDPSGTVKDQNNAVRSAQGTILRLWLLSMTEECANQIVMGDLNCQPTSENLKTIIRGEGALSNSMTDAIIKGDVGNTIVSNNVYRVGQRVIDHVLYNDDALEAAEYTVIYNLVDKNGAACPSDHLPVIAKFNYYE